MIYKDTVFIFTKLPEKPKLNKTIQYFTLENLLNKFVSSSKKHSVHIRDEEYFLINKKEMEKILQLNYFSKMQWIANSRDCDNFSDVLQGLISSLGYRIAFGSVEVETEQGLHALNFFIDENKVIWYIEPQTNKIFLKNDYKPYWVVI